MSTYVPIQTVTLTTAVPHITFSDIPQTYSDLVLVANLRSSDSRSGYQSVSTYFNGDTGSNYSKTAMYGSGSAAVSFRQTNTSTLELDCSMNGSTSGIFVTNIVHIMNYSNNTTNKTILFRNGDVGNAPTLQVGSWRSTSAITSITITEPSNLTWVAGTNITLYGIGQGSPKAFGGDEVRTDGTYWYHIFRSSGRFEPVQNISNVDYLVVAGGGAGSQGGGGAGGYRCSVTGELSGRNSSPESKLSLTAHVPYTVTIGAGGTANSNTTAGTNGSNSIFGSITSTGGGRGGQFGGGADGNGSIGGSGGGGGGHNAGGTPGTGATGTTAQGFGGGNGTEVTTFNAGGGGGGAGGAGTNGNGSTNGVGGVGIQSSITGTATFRAGGGSGGGNNTTTGGNGGGGSGGGSSQAGTAATANTGGGGGGGGNQVSVAAGNGGSGIVIVRYAV